MDVGSLVKESHSFSKKGTGGFVSKVGIFWVVQNTFFKEYANFTSRYHHSTDLFSLLF